MEYEEFKIKKQKLRDDHLKEVSELSTSYALSNNSVKLGDFVTDNTGTIRVDSINTYLGFYGDGQPQCAYYGIMLTKKNKPFKSGEKRYLYQSNIKLHQTNF